ncbi:MAG: Asp-tRNA(Asn)/Glu-tRNA(Gln) amidotransferase subunit GatC [Gallionella sp.]|nr:MAG: Asp-tRNA(Asn)/Glu-tRNA(Gln) amidotransferase subunit GatC [Gallionella sp.]
MLPTTSLANADVRKVARLARLAMSETEIETARSQLSGIFDLIAEMQAVDTVGIVPMSHAQDVSQRLREDTVTETNQRDLFQSIAPQAEAGLYLVPQVIE